MTTKILNTPRTTESPTSTISPSISETYSGTNQPLQAEEENTRATADNFCAEFPLLSSFGTLITESSDTTICVDAEKIGDIAVIVNSVSHRNLTLCGKAGVGKTATVYALAKYLASAACSGKSRLRDMLIVQIDLNRLKSIGTNQSVIEKNIKDLWEEAERSDNIVLFIDEGHRIATGGADSIGNILKPLVLKGKVPVILATTEDEFRRYVEHDEALRRRFHPVSVEEPKGETLLAILKSKGADFTQKLKVKISDEIYAKTMELAERYIHETANPDKSIRLLELACSKASGRKEWADVSEGDLSEALRIVAKVTLQKNDVSVSAEDITAELRLKIKGQDVATDKIGKFISQYRSGALQKDDVPVSLALLGPGGCGKTELAKEIASRLGYKKSAGEIIEIKMSELHVKDAAGTLLGKKIDERVVPGRLTEPVRKNPNRFIIIDQIEDMPNDVGSILAQIVVNGTVQDALGYDVCFKNTVVVFTGNIGSGGGDFGFTSNTSPSEMSRKAEDDLLEKLRKSFNSEFRSNIDVLVPFVELSQTAVMDIIRLNCDAEIADDACEYIADLCRYKIYGASEVRSKLKSIMLDLALASAHGVRIVLEGGVLRAVRKEGVNATDFSNNLS